jgi:hypothetical protein
MLRDNIKMDRNATYCKDLATKQKSSVSDFSINGAER